jgi:hypothetical protein
MMARERKFSYTRENGVWSIYPVGEAGEGTPIESFDVKELPEAVHTGLMLEGLVKLCSQESATDGGSSDEAMLASYRSTFNRLKAGKLAKERESGEKAKSLSRWTESVLQWALKLKGMDVSKWRGLAVTLQFMDQDGTVNLTAQEQKNALRSKAKDMPIISEAIEKTEQGESPVEIEAIEL